MTIDNDLINEILKIAYKAVPKKCALDGTKLIEVHNEIGEFLKIKLLNKAHVIKSVCICGSEEPYKPSKSAKGYEYCPKCYISRQMQTVL